MSVFWVLINLVIALILANPSPALEELSERSIAEDDVGLRVAANGSDKEDFAKLRFKSRATLGLLI